MRTSLHCAVAISVATAFMVSAFFLCGCDKDDELLIELEDAELSDTELEDTERSDAEYVDSVREGSSGRNRNANASSESGSLNKPVASSESGSLNKQVESREPREIIYVHVCGCVNNPGVFAVNEGTRVVEVIEAAGGYTYEADGDYLNLAASVSDGQKIYVPSVYDEIYDTSGTVGTENYGTAGAGNYGITGTGDSGPNGNESAASDGKVNINSAGKSDFMTIKGIGEKRADAIIKYRDECGGFSGVEDLMNVPGIKEGTFNKIKDYLTI